LASNKPLLFANARLCRLPALWLFWFPPQSIDKDPDRTAGRSHVLDLLTGYPVVDGSTTNANQFTSFHDRNCFSIRKH